MLKTSPMLSANASPSAFRYAPASPQSSSQSSAALRRRLSSRSGSSSDSLKASPHHPPRLHVANDSSAHLSPKSLSQGSGASQASTSSCPPPMAKPSAGPAQPVSEATSQDLSAQSGVSPVKRRSSPPNAARPPTPSGSGSSSSSTKRSKPDAPPPKTLPRRYEFCSTEHMVELIAHMLSELIATNDAIKISSGGLTRFHSRTAPGISVRDYLHRLARHATLTPPLLLAMVYYIDRLCALYSEFTINTLTVHRFLITAATVAAKGLSDSFWNNTTYARVGGVRVAELKLLELEFLYRVDWKIVPNPEVLVAYYKGLVERTPGYELESDESDSETTSSDDSLPRPAQA